MKWRLQRKKTFFFFRRNIKRRHLGWLIYGNLSSLNFLAFLRWIAFISSCRLCEKDPYQLYQRLEQQAREYVLEMKVRLLKHLSTGPKTTGPAGTVAAAQGPPQAYQFISLLLEEYSALCQAARTISSFLLTLVSLPFV